MFVQLRLYNIKASQKHPGAIIKKDFSMFLFIDKTHGEKQEFSVSEFAGFNTGNLLEEQRKDLDGKKGTLS